MPEVVLANTLGWSSYITHGILGRPGQTRIRPRISRPWCHGIFQRVDTGSRHAAADAEACKLLRSVSYGGFYLT